MIELVLESAHTASLLSEAVAEKQAIVLPTQLKTVFVAWKLLELLVVFNFKNVSYFLDFN